MALFIAFSLVKSLGLSYRKEPIQINTLGNHRSVAVGTTSCLIYSKLHSDRPLLVDFIILPHITSLTPATEVSEEIVERFESFPLADPQFYVPGPVEILLGADHFLNVIYTEKILGQPSAVNTIFGWVIMGGWSTTQRPSGVAVFLGSVSLDELVKRFWEIEELPTIARENPEDIYVNFQFETYTLLAENRFNVPLLLRPDAELGNLYHSALSWITEIIDTSSPSIWLHVPSADNPVDIASRGYLPTELISNPLWWHGPLWLTQGKSQWPSSMTEKLPIETIPELK